ncbi:MAG: response regulator [bacterium]|nr:response regulator [bacterium]
MKHILIVEDEQDTLENLIGKITDAFPDYKISSAFDCDEGFRILNSSKVQFPIDLLITDLTFRRQPVSRVIKDGQSLLQRIKNLNYKLPRIIYSSHDELKFIHPVMQNFEPEGYVLKASDSTSELLLAIPRVLNGKTYYSQEVLDSQKKRFEFAMQLDEIDKKIIAFLPDINCITDWDDLYEAGKIPIKYKSVNKRLQSIFEKMDVTNEKQLLLKLYQQAIIGT